MEGNWIACCGFKRSSRVNMVNFLPAPTARWEDDRDKQNNTKLFAKIWVQQRATEGRERSKHFCCCFPGMLFCVILSNHWSHIKSFTKSFQEIRGQWTSVPHQWISCQNNKVKSKRKKSILWICQNSILYSRCPKLPTGWEMRIDTSRCIVRCQFEHFARRHAASSFAPVHVHNFEHWTVSL